MNVAPYEYSKLLSAHAENWFRVLLGMFCQIPPLLFRFMPKDLYEEFLSPPNIIFLFWGCVVKF